ncbi:hypothetical protein H5410_045557 [Solanum commersonii]|uniref:Disease resistance protein winged helix domain-containing protein n=1 Tax=Solanum commersonii TaxID=4109 RepID=A0A9J5X9X4_SOLCO|nr:hypothetical protein H5410_045557 [Solanum commersonii]
MALSYHHLPSHLKPCFLYFAIFPEDELIFVDKIVKLWVVEGFLKVEEMKTIKEVAETCLNELIDRNLISINNYSFDGKIESCGIMMEKNDQIPNVESMHFSSMSQVRISIQYVMFKHTIEKLLDTAELSDHMRYYSPKFPFNLVRVLDLTLVRCNTFPCLILDLIHLRNLALTLFPSLDSRQEKEVFSSIDILPSISNLCYLQTFIISHGRAVECPFILPSEMLIMSQLRQLQKSTLVLKNLGCLSSWNPWYCTSSDLRLFPKLKKLQIYDQLEELEFRLSYTLASCFLESITPSGPLRFQREARHCGDLVPPLLLSPLDAFPQNLKKLIFSGHFFMPWKDFSIVGKLPKLESLKLSYTFFIDREWEISREGFPYLKFVLLEYLNIRYWRASCDHFPCLERLFLEGFLCLDSIPQDFADITTFALIYICRCAQSVGNSAKQIQ